MIYTHPLVNYFNSNNDNEILLQELKKHNIIYKKQGDLCIFKYTDKSKHGTILNRFCRGVIINLNTNQLLCSSIDGDISYEDFKDNVPLKYCVIEENIDGTLLNAYYYNNRWNISTKFSIDAHDSRFRGDKTFRQLFDKYINLNKLSLDTKYTYSFVLKKNDYTLYNKDEKSEIFHIESTNNINGEKISINLGISKPKILYYNNYNEIMDINSYDDLSNYLNNLNWNNKGYMLYSRDRKFRCSLVNPNYLKVQSLLEDQNDINFICFKSYYYKKNKDEILKYFPEYVDNYINVTKLFERLLTYTLNLYKDIKCFHKKREIPIHLEKSIRKIHQIYKENVINNPSFRIERLDVKDYFLSLDVNLLYTLINQY